MKILLINPPITISVLDAAYPHPPLGIAYIAALLEENGFDVKILDAFAEGIDNKRVHDNCLTIGLDNKNIRKCVNLFQPNLIGVSCQYTAHAQDAHNVAKIVKETLPEAIVVFGGAHPSANPQMVLRDKNVDMVVKGEGEITFLDLCQKIEKNQKITRILGTIVRGRNKIFFSPARPYIQNLDTIPFPARHLLPMKIYFEKTKHLPWVMRQPVTTMITSRGCPGHCVYCSIHAVWGYNWRSRSAKNVVDEIEYLIQAYKIKEISFEDDNISLDKNRMFQICDEIIKRKLDIKWTTPNGTAIWTLDKLVVKKMKDSGCYKLTFGLESGNPETLKFIRKSYDFSKVQSLIKYANKSGMWTVSTFIIGFPYEPLNSIEDTINWAINSDVDFAIFYIATPFPGTELYNIFDKEKLLSEKQASEFIGGCDTNFFTKNELVKFQGMAYQNFMNNRFLKFLDPTRITRKIRSIEDLKLVFRLIKKIVGVKAGKGKIWENP